ncbi:hypothetical protein niasHS_008752 [Heterodera schachtii]|uniref:Uncharacterized protein n=1 Tax=Heterodera schachtii TaxID=97005 RepID=A0ABD2J9W7_HETSC
MPAALLTLATGHPVDHLDAKSNIHVAICCHANQQLRLETVQRRQKLRQLQARGRRKSQTTRDLIASTKKSLGMLAWPPATAFYAPAIIQAYGRGENGKFHTPAYIGGRYRLLFMASKNARIKSAAWYANRGVHYKIKDCPDIPDDEDGYVPPEQPGVIAGQLPVTLANALQDHLLGPAYREAIIGQQPTDEIASAFDAFAQKAEDFVDQLRTRIMELEQQNRTLQRNLRQKVANHERRVARAEENQANIQAIVGDVFTVVFCVSRHHWRRHTETTSQHHRRRVKPLNFDSSDPPPHQAPLLRQHSPLAPQQQGMDRRVVNYTPSEGTPSPLQQRDLRQQLLARNAQVRAENQAALQVSPLVHQERDFELPNEFHILQIVIQTPNAVRRQPEQQPIHANLLHITPQQMAQLMVLRQRAESLRDSPARIEEVDEVEEQDLEE